MATIPLGSFDRPNVGPQLNRVQPVDEGGEQVGQAIGQIGQALTGVSRQLEDVAVQAHQQQQALARAKATNAATQYQLDVDAAVADVGDQLRRGGDYTKATESYDEKLAAMPAPVVDGLSPEGQVAYSGMLEATRRQGTAKINALAVGARRDAGQRELATTIDLAGKTAGQPGADIETINARLKQMGQVYVENFGLDGSTVEKAIQDRIDGNWTQQASAKFNSGHDDIAALQQLQTELTSEDGFYADKLDADKRNAMALRVSGRIDVLQGRAERATDRAQAAADRALVQIAEQASSPYPPTPDQLAAWSEAVGKGTDAQKEEFRGYLQDARDTQSLLQKPVEEQLAAVRDKQAALVTGGADKRQRANFERLQNAVNANVKMLTETPLQYIQTRLGEQVTPLSISALADPAMAGGFSSQLQHRAIEVEALRKRYGTQVRQALLLPEEATMLTKAVDATAASKRGELFGTLRRLSGSDSTYRAVMQQIAPDAPVTALTGLLHPRNPSAARTLAIGDALLNGTKGDNLENGGGTKLKMPSPDEFNASFDDAIGRAFRGRPQALGIAQQAVRAHYAGAMASDGDTSGLFSERRLRNSIKAVLGETADVNGNGEVFAPYGMDIDDFEDKLEAAWIQTRDNRLSGLPDDFDDYGLEQADEGVYRVTIAGRYASDKAGRPLLLRVQR